MCKKWTEEEFKTRVKALEVKKQRKVKVRNGLNTIKGAIISNSVFLMLYKIADMTY